MRVKGIERKDRKKERKKDKEVGKREVGLKLPILFFLHPVGRWKFFSSDARNKLCHNSHNKETRNLSTKESGIFNKF